MTDTNQNAEPRGALSRMDELLTLLRTEAAILQADEKPHALPEVRRPLQAARLWESTEEPFPVKQVYHVNEFLIYEDVAFVGNAFRGIMQREPDETGFDIYTAMLRNEGSACKASILFSLMESAEAREKGVYVTGLRWERWHRNYQDKWWFKQPLINKVLAFCAYLLSNELQDLSRETEQLRRRHKLQVDNHLEQQEQLLRYLGERDDKREAELLAIDQKLDGYRRETRLVRQDLLLQQQQLNLLLSDLRSELALSDVSIERKQQLAEHAADKLDRFYLQFEDECRGDESAISEQLQHYLAPVQACPALSPTTPLLDIGSGRGEWLALLGKQGVSAQGVDVSQVLAQHCREQGLGVAVADGLEYLLSIEDASLGVVTSFHVIEHLPFEQLFSLVEQCHRVLAPNGLLIFETPNPENLRVGTHTFYHDPTHRNPITPTLIDFLLRHLGFVDTRVERLHPYPESARVRGFDALTEQVNGAFCGPQDFAIFATRPA